MLDLFWSSAITASTEGGDDVLFLVGAWASSGRSRGFMLVCVIAWFEVEQEIEGFSEVFELLLRIFSSFLNSFVSLFRDSSFIFSAWDSVNGSFKLETIGGTDFFRF